MLDIIQMAFGDLNKFNDSVRSILHAIAACHASDGEKRGTSERDALGCAWSYGLLRRLRDLTQGVQT